MSKNVVATSLTDSNRFVRNYSVTIFWRCDHARKKWLKLIKITNETINTNCCNLNLNYISNQTVNQKLPKCKMLQNSKGKINQKKNADAKIFLL